MRAQGHWGRVLTGRQQDQRGGGLGKCSRCKVGYHHLCDNRAYDDILGRAGNCHCAYMDHGVRPSERMVDDIAAPENVQDAYENKTMGMDR